MSKVRSEQTSAAPRAFSVATFCERYGISRAYTYVLIKRGELNAVKMGNRTLIPVESADTWFATLPSFGGEN